MIVKLAIIGVILLVGGVLFFPDSFEKIENMVPQEAQPINEGAKKVRDDTANALNSKVDNTIDSISEKVSSLKGISVFPVEEKDSDSSKIGYVKDKDYKTKSNDHDTSVKGSGVNEETAKDQLGFEEFVFEELSLTTKHGKDGVNVSYNDDSGKTISVDIVMKNSERTLFTGTFHSSNFDAVIADVKNEPYFVELVIEHGEYGTLRSSTYNSGSSDSEINGIFTKS